MFASGIIDTVLDMIDSQIQFEDIWELRNIRFDSDPEDEKKPFERYLMTSYNVEDVKGNPGHRGHFHITNLRIIWSMAIDNYINLSIGLDAINNVSIKTIPVGGGSSFKYQMILKTENPSQTKYEFKFMGFSEKEFRVFQKLKEAHQKIADTRSYRSSNLAVKCDPEFIPLENQQIKSEYANSFLYEDNRKIKCTYVLSNVRLIILKEGEKKMNYGIPWIMIKSLDKDELYNKQVIVIKCRGILNKKQLRLLNEKGSEMKKFECEMKSFCEIYNKNPILGYSFKIEQKNENMSEKMVPETEIDEIEETKVNLVGRGNAYDTNKKSGSLFETCFNEEVGIMMQNFPEGVTRKYLWEIINK